MTGDGCRNFDSVSEKEANELGFMLLIPRWAALRIVEMRIPLESACIEYGVSSSLLNYRIRITNAPGWARNRGRRFSAAE
jgi:Zn-dependent peptidase ImmA (M78 family)